MNEQRSEQHIDSELKHYFALAKAQKCPPSMKKNLYSQLPVGKPRLWQPTRLALAGISLVFVTSVLFKFNAYQQDKHHELLQAQADLEVAMHYMNRVSLKSITSVHNKGIKPGLIKPLAKSVAAL